MRRRAGPSARVREAPPNAPAFAAQPAGAVRADDYFYYRYFREKRGHVARGGSKRARDIGGTGEPGLEEDDADFSGMMGVAARSKRRKGTSEAAELDLDAIAVEGFGESDDEAGDDGTHGRTSVFAAAEDFGELMAEAAEAEGDVKHGSGHRRRGKQRPAHQGAGQGARQGGRGQRRKTRRKRGK